jgi:hypothetical protein
VDGQGSNNAGEDWACFVPPQDDVVDRRSLPAPLLFCSA